MTRASVTACAIGIVVGTGVAVATNLGGDEKTGPISGRPDARVLTRSCKSRVESRPLPDPGVHDVVVGPITFYALADARLMDRDDFESNRVRRHGYPPFKTVTTVRRNAQVTVSVARNADSRLALTYDPSRWDEGFRRLADHPKSVHFEACPEEGRRSRDHSGRYRALAFNGGFLPARPGCVTIQVTVGGGAGATRRVGFATGKRRCASGPP